MLLRVKPVRLRASAAPSDAPAMSECWVSSCCRFRSRERQARRSMCDSVSSAPAALIGCSKVQESKAGTDVK